MTAFRLRPCEGREDIVLPAGKTTIGRGPYLGVSDKRVSRSHAMLEVSDGKLTVLPLHTNPTFYKTSKEDKFIALNKDAVKELKAGNFISLLPDKLSFEIICNGGSTETDLPQKGTIVEHSKNSTGVKKTSHDLPDAKRNKSLYPVRESEKPTSSILDEFMTNEPSTSTVQTEAVPQEISSLKVHTESAMVLTTEPNASLSHCPSPMSVNFGFQNDMKSVNSPCKATVQPAALLQKTRKLPSWLQKTSETKSPSKPTVNKKEKAKRDTKECTVRKSPEERNKESDKRKKGNGAQGKRKTNKEHSSDEDVRKNTKRSRQTRVLSDDDDDESLPLQSAVRMTDVSRDGSGSAEDQPSDSEDEQPAMLTKEKTTTTKTGHTDIRKREPPACPYGKMCYRKNPAHFKEYSHQDSSDEDRKAEGNISNDDRPLCPYGSSCYRKNPQHKHDYRHTEPPGRPKRKAATHRSILDGGSDDNGSPNTYDYNDSFIDDGSDAAAGSSSSYEGSDDSDWQPQGDDADDDVNELITEARSFLHNKKMTKPV